MRIGIVGLGKLGLPTAISIAHKGHDVMGYDINPGIKAYIDAKHLPYREAGPDATGDINSLFKKVDVKWGSMEEVVGHSEIIFITVQTPHDPMYEGLNPMPEERKDFDYTWLIDATKAVAGEAEKQAKDVVVVIVSTVLPGTIRREILPHMGPHTRLNYGPQFIAMGTVMRDYLNPEFNLFGLIDTVAADKTEEFYKTVNSAPFVRMSLESAELSKVAYNVMVGKKITFANQMMEVCHKTPNANVDDVMSFIKMAKERLISPKYLNAGMGDSGGCHPRDGIALSWLAQQLHLRYDMFGELMRCRELQTEFLADVVEEEHKSTGLPIMILGYTYKVETDLTTGSCAILLQNILNGRGIKADKFDFHVSGFDLNWKDPMLFFIGMNHQYLLDNKFPAGSVVIDPWGYFYDSTDKIRVIKIGRPQSDKI